MSLEIMPEKNQTTVFCQTMATRIGFLYIRASDAHVLEVSFRDKQSAEVENPNLLTKEASRQLQAYFDQHLEVFDLPLYFQGTSFQQSVWKALQEIPFGKTISYLTLARSIDNEKAIRAVGRANGQNPFPVIVPCHRVIGHDGKLAGYSGGLWRKKWLLRHEKILIQTELAFPEENESNRDNKHFKA